MLEYRRGLDVIYAYAQIYACIHLSTARPNAVEPVSFPSAVFGMPLTVSCPLSSNPNSTYSWIRYSDIDRERRLPWPNGLIFIESDTNQTWATDYWSSDYNGFYVCCAENILATLCFHDVNQLRLFADSESNTQVGDRQ